MVMYARNETWRRGAIPADVVDQKKKESVEWWRTVVLSGRNGCWYDGMG